MIPGASAVWTNVMHFTSASEPTQALPPVQPWLLQHHFDGEIDLIKEIWRALPQVPVMSLIHTREVGTQNRRGVADLGDAGRRGQSGGRVDALSAASQFTFTLSTRCWRCASVPAG